MPKVNKDYFDKKKNEILDAAYTIFLRKPLYEMTMLDVIKEAGLSKGGIYRYFADIDDVIIALINRETANTNYKKEIDEILQDTDTSGTIEALFTFLGNYIDKSPAIIGKIQFELTVYFSNHPEKAEKFKDSLTAQENGQYLVGALLNKITEGVNKGEFKPLFPLNNIFTYIITSIEGVVNRVVMQKCYRAESIDAPEIFKIISKSVLSMLGVEILKG